MNCTIDPTTEQVFICSETPEQYYDRTADWETMFTEYYDENKFEMAEMNYWYASSD